MDYTWEELNSKKFEELKKIVETDTRVKDRNKHKSGSINYDIIKESYHNDITKALDELKNISIEEDGNYKLPEHIRGKLEEIKRTFKRVDKNKQDKAGSASSPKLNMEELAGTLLKALEDGFKSRNEYKSQLSIAEGAELLSLQLINMDDYLEDLVSLYECGNRHKSILSIIRILIILIIKAGLRSGEAEIV